MYSEIYGYLACVEFGDRVGISYLGSEVYSTRVRLVKGAGDWGTGVYPAGVEFVTGIGISCSGIEGYPTGVKLADRVGAWRSGVGGYFNGAELIEVEEHFVVTALVDEVGALYPEAWGALVEGVGASYS